MEFIPQKLVFALTGLLMAGLIIAERPASALAAGEFAWQSISFDGGVDPILSGSIAGPIDGTPVPATQMSQLENTGLDFHLRWSSQLAPHLGLRFSVGYASFSPSLGFHGFSALPLTVGATVPLFDPRAQVDGQIGDDRFLCGPGIEERNRCSDRKRKRRKPVES